MSQSLREHLFERSITPLVVSTAAAAPVAYVLTGDGLSFVRVVPYLAALTLGLAALRLGYPGLAARIAIGGCSLLLLAKVVHDGASAQDLAFLPLLAVIGWTWLGRTDGIAMIGLCVASMVAAVASGRPPAEVSHWILAISHVVSVAMVAAFTWRTREELRRQTERSQAQAEQAERSAAEAEAADAARDRFLAMVSHELRTPLDTVLGYTEILVEDETDGQRVDDLSRVRSAGRQLQGLLDDILDMSRVLAHDLPVVRSEVAVGALVDEVVRTISPQIADRGNRLTVDLAADLPPLVSDPHRIRQILLNLASNAAKYTERGSIHIGVVSRGGRFVFSVRDTGIGIPEERLHQLFTPFVQLHEGPERRPGIGLGLALSQKLAQRLGGRIEAASEVGRGSTLRLVLPVAPRAAPPPAPELVSSGA